MKIRSSVLAALAATLFAAAPAHAKDLIYGSGIPEKNPLMSKASRPFLAEVNKQSGGSMNWKMLAGAQMISLNSALDGLKNSLVDAAFIVPVFQRSALINNNVLFDAQSFGDNSVQVTGATVETIMLECPECLADYRRGNAMYLGAGFSPTPFNLICKNPVKTLNDIKGIKVRATGAETRLIASLGGTAISMGPADMVQAIERGAIDCAHAPVAWLRSYGLVDVAKNVLVAPMGIARAMSLFIMNRKTWQSLPKKDRAIIWSNIPMASARGQLLAYTEVDRQVRKEAEGKGVKFYEAGPDLIEALDKHAAHEEKILPALLKKQGAKDPERLLKVYLAKLKKWKPLAAEIGDDMDKYVAIFKREIYDKVDPDKL
jgi:TRAP-type transport system periplasmic protein